MTVSDWHCVSAHGESVRVSRTHRSGISPRTIRYDPEATDDAATLETLRTLGTPQSEPTPRSDRGLKVLNHLSDKHSAGVVLTETDRVMIRLLERFETGLA